MVNTRADDYAPPGRMMCSVCGEFHAATALCAGKAVATVDKTLDERGKRYGSFRGHARISMRLKNAMRDGTSWIELDDDMKEALDMIQHKIARILNGDPRYADSWHDISGYATLVERSLLDGDR